MDVRGALIVVPEVFRDARGYFKETYSRDRYRDAGIADEFVQDNLSLSRAGTLRGLHGDPRMAKLVQVLAGQAYDVVVDARPQSPTYGRWQGVRLRGSEHAQLYIPPGCLHGFLALADDTLLSYKQSTAYDPNAEFAVAWDDPDLAIAWPLDGLTPELSEKDRAHPTLRALSGLRA